MEMLLREFPTQRFYKTVIALICSKFSKYFRYLTVVMCKECKVMLKRISMSKVNKRQGNHFE